MVLYPHSRVSETIAFTLVQLLQLLGYSSFLLIPREEQRIFITRILRGRKEGPRGLRGLRMNISARRALQIELDTMESAMDGRQIAYFTT